MNYLDEDISVTFTGLEAGKYHTYMISLLHEDGEHLIFVGRAYAITSELTIQIAEILVNLRHVQKEMNTHPMGIINDVKVTLGDQYRQLRVCFAFRYTNSNTWLDSFKENVATLTPLIQGTEANGVRYESKLLPHFPVTNNIGFPFVYYVSDKMSTDGDEYVEFYKDNTFLFGSNYEDGVNVAYLPTGNLYIAVPEWGEVDGFDVIGVQPTVEGEQEIVLGSFYTREEAEAFKETVPPFMYLRVFIRASKLPYKSQIAIADDCPARYYLIWQDRLGGIQSQPFKSSIYTEDLTTVEIGDYLGHSAVASKAVQPKWQLSSGWIKEEYYPYYESILVSPTITLYDTKLDKAFKVLTTDEGYTEKTFKNSKSLINLTINLKLDKSQIIY